MSKYYQYLKERFPLSQFIPLSLFLALSASFGVQYYLRGSISSISPIVISFLALFLFFLRLRLFDEHKDAEHDKEYYSDRPIPRGLITLKEITRIIFLVIIFEITLGALAGVNSLGLFLFTFSYSLLMFKEFFIDKWLREHFTAYIFSHEILIFPLFFYLFAINGFLISMVSEKYFWYLSFFIGLQLFLLEVTRKVRAKENEIESRDTYTAQYGVFGASSLVAVLSLFVVLLSYDLDKILFGDCIFITNLTTVLYLIFLIVILRFVKNPVHKNSKLVFNSSIVFVFVTQLIFLIKFFL